MAGRGKTNHTQTMQPCSWTSRSSATVRRLTTSEQLPDPQTDSGRCRKPGQRRHGYHRHHHQRGRHTRRHPHRHAPCRRTHQMQRTPEGQRPRRFNAQLLLLKGMGRASRAQQRCHDHDHRSIVMLFKSVNNNAMRMWEQMPWIRTCLLLAANKCSHASCVPVRAVASAHPSTLCQLLQTAS